MHTQKDEKIVFFFLFHYRTCHNNPYNKYKYQGRTLFRFICIVYWIFFIFFLYWTRFEIIYCQEWHLPDSDILGLVINTTQAPFEIPPIKMPAACQWHDFETNPRHALTRHTIFEPHRSLFCTCPWLTDRHTCWECHTLMSVFCWLQQLSLTLYSLPNNSNRNFQSIHLQTKTWNKACIWKHNNLYLKIVTSFKSIK